MAENKKSFILYADMIHTVRKMPIEKAGELFMTILGYVNDENPVVEDMVVDLVFEPIKHQLKRDLIRWEDFKKRQALNGKKGGRPVKSEPQTVELDETQINPNNPSLFLETQKSLNVTVNDTVTVNVNENEYKSPTHTQVKEQFFLHRRSGWSDVKCTVEATNFFDHYESVGWRINGHIMQNWQARVRKWINDERTNKAESKLDIQTTALNFKNK